MSSVSEFPIIKATEWALCRRTPLWGFGKNDAWYLVQPKINGKKLVCPYYEVWVGMLRRCYNPVWLNKHPTYIDCVVCDKWLIFSNFRAWMVDQDWEGKTIDKDLRKIENKIYSPDTCCFVSQRINSILLEAGSARSKYYIGVCYSKGRFLATCRDPSKTTAYIGYFDTELKAHQAYLRAKAEVIRSAVKECGSELHPEVIATLKLKANQNTYLAHLIG